MKEQQFILIKGTIIENTNMRTLRDGRKFVNSILHFGSVSYRRVTFLCVRPQEELGEG